MITRAFFESANAITVHTSQTMHTRKVRVSEIFRQSAERVQIELRNTVEDESRFVVVVVNLDSPVSSFVAAGPWFGAEEGLRVFEEMIVQHSRVTRAIDPHAPTKLVSVNNGATWQLADELSDDTLAEHWAAIVNVMDGDTARRVHSDHAPCSNREFLKRYLQSAPDHLILG